MEQTVKAKRPRANTEIGNMMIKVMELQHELDGAKYDLMRELIERGDDRYISISWSKLRADLERQVI